LTVDKLTHKPTDYSFLFDFDSRMRHHGYMRPGEHSPERHVITPIWAPQPA
jgi:hypothetical protein